MSKTKTSSPYEYLVFAASGRVTGRLSPDLIAYVTDGGTYVLATDPTWTDSGKPRDLIAILPAPLEGSRVLQLWPAVNPDLVAALRAALDEGAAA